MRSPEGREQPYHFTVRDAGKDDSTSIAEIQRRSWLETYPNEKLGISRQDIESHIGELSDTVNEWSDSFESLDSERTKTFVIEENGEIIGFCQVKKFEKENRVVSLHLDPQYRGVGAGAKIFHDALTWLGDEKDISLGVVEANERAISFYQKYDFQDDGKAPDLFVNNKPMPTIRMVRRRREHRNEIES